VLDRLVSHATVPESSTNGTFADAVVRVTLGPPAIVPAPSISGTLVGVRVLGEDLAGQHERGRMGMTSSGTDAYSVASREEATVSTRLDEPRTETQDGFWTSA
jgi:hypothetical protein